MRQIIPTGANTLLQSSYLYIQAAGSDGSDRSAPGIDLRWSLMKELGDMHLPKGDYAQSSWGFNQPADYVKVYRSRNPNVGLQLDFQSIPSLFQEAGNTRYWQYTLPNPLPYMPGTSTVILRFTDVTAYDALRSTINPHTSAYQFLTHYAAVLEVEVFNQLMYCALFEKITPVSQTRPRPVIGPITSITSVRNVLNTIQVAPGFNVSTGNTTSPPGTSTTGSGGQSSNFNFNLPSVQINTPALAGQTSVTVNNSSGIKVESVTLKDTSDPTSTVISSRKIFTAVMPPTETRICCENISYFRFQAVGAFPTVLMLQTYFITFNFLDQPQSGSAFGWNLINGFALTTDDHTALNVRLEQSSFIIDKKWPKFKDGDSVIKQNYITRWQNGGTTGGLGIKAGVQQYIALTDINGNYDGDVSYDTAGNNPPQSDPSLSYSMLVSLNLAALDFHVARMLGLGYIDILPAVGVNISPTPANDAVTATIAPEYIYCAVYNTQASIPNAASTGSLQHIYMTLPTSIIDYRYPKAPNFLPITYGLSLQSGGDSDPIAITDADGYLPNYDERYVDLNVDQQSVYENFGPFFYRTDLFCACDYSDPVMFGAEYKLDSETNWRTQEICNNPDFPGYNIFYPTLQLNEVNGILNSDNPIYLHQETEEGIHDYAIYGINWFSRSSPLSNVQKTDYTKFDKTNNLVPPVPLNVVYVEEESPLFLTSQWEQDLLTTRRGLYTDYYFTRAIFEWNQVQNVNYQFADKVNFYFRPDQLLSVQGDLASVTWLSTQTVQVTTTDFLLASLTPVQTVTPVINNDPVTIARFIGAMLTTPSGSFQVLSVDSAGTDPVLTLQCNRVINSIPVDSNEDDGYMSTATWVSPQPGERFMLVENAQNLASWQKLNKQVTLDPVSLGTYQETQPDPNNGGTVTFHIGGIYDVADVKDLYVHSGYTDTTKLGYYEITFANAVLPAHPSGDPDCYWYGGSVRMDATNLTEKKLLKVVNIHADPVTRAPHSPLKIYVFDPDYPSGLQAGQDPYSLIDPATASPYLVPPTNLHYSLIIPGTAVNVNFHPGYLTYLYAEPGNNFDKAHIYPAKNQGTKVTYMGVTAVDDTKNKESRLGLPAQLYAVELNPPQQPQEPGGPLFATRPDYYGKSTYTFDTQIERDATRDPYSLVFFKGNHMVILKSLYEEFPPLGSTSTPLRNTVQEILEDLATITNDAYYYDRYYHLVNQSLHDFLDGTLGGVQGDPSNFRFPMPSKSGFFYYDTLNPPVGYDPQNPGALYSQPVYGALYPFDGTHARGSQTFTDGLTKAIQGAFIPLTKTPVMFQFIQPGTQPLNVAPVTNVDPSDPTFDPFPMVRLLPDNITVRFTDFTIEGAAQDLYFYAAAELSNKLEYSPWSSISRPVILVNSAPAVKTQIRKVVSSLPNAVLGIPTSVQFDITQYLDSDNIKRINIFRTISQVDSLSVRTMTKLPVIDWGNPIVDDFSDLDSPPYGTPIYYRINVEREIINEDGNVEYIPSLPSDRAIASVVDVNNPAPAQLTSTYTQSTGPLTYNNVVLSWNKTTYNGTYYLYQMNASGNWVKLFQIQTDDATQLEYNLPTPLLKQQPDNTNIYYRFKVDVENASGLLNLTELDYII